MTDTVATPPVTERSVVEAVRAELRALLRDDDRVVLLGEDIGPLGGVFRATDGLLQEFGEDRVIDTPMAELSIVGVAIGMALRGLRPIAEIQFGDFIFAAADQILSEAAKIRFRTRGEWSVPLVIRATWGAGIHGGLYHSQSIEAVFSHYPGLKVVAASNPADAAGLLRAAVEDPDPVIVLEHKLVYRKIRGAVPDPLPVVPIGKAAVVRPGSDVTVFAYGAMVHESLSAAERLAQDGGPDVEVVDLRTLLPLDRETIVASAARTGRVVVVHEDSRTMGLGAEISAIVHEGCFDQLAAPVTRVTMPDVAGIPFSSSLESALLPHAGHIVDAVRALANRHRGAAAQPAARPDVSSYHDSSAPQASMSTTVEIDGLDDRVELTAHLVTAAAAALADLPDANGYWTARGIVHRDGANIEVVEPDETGTRGRGVVVADAEDLSPLGAARALQRAREGAAVTAADPTFTLVVPGGAATSGTPRVRDGQSAAVQAGAPVAAVVSDGAGLRFARQITLTVSVDHRVLDGAGSARILETMKRTLEDRRS